MRMNERYELREHGKVYTFFNKLMKNPYFLIAPAVIFDLWLTVYPMCFAIYMSFFKWDPISGRKTGSVQTALVQTRESIV